MDPILTRDEQLAERMIEHQLRLTRQVTALFPGLHDQHDPATQPSLQGQQPATRVPLGCNACDACQRVSKIYDLFPTCRECLDTFCEECRVTSLDDEDYTGATTVCRPCFLAQQIDDRSVLNDWLLTSGKIAPEDVERLRLMWAGSPIDLDTVSRVGTAADSWKLRHPDPAVRERLIWLATWCEQIEHQHGGAAMGMGGGR